MSNFVLVTGPMFSVYCVGCGKYLKAGDQDGISCYNWKPVPCDKVYADADGPAFESYYCEPCASKHSEGAHDPTRSTDAFFSNTEGTVIDYGNPS